MASSSHFAAATLPEFAFSVNFPLSRPDSTLEIVQSGNLEVKDKEIYNFYTKELYTYSVASPLTSCLVKIKWFFRIQQH
jgi:hypothetical protein